RYTAIQNLNWKPLSKTPVPAQQVLLSTYRVSSRQRMATCIRFITAAMDSTQKEIIKKAVFYVSKQVRPSLIKAIILQPKTNQMAVSLLKQPTSVTINYSPRSIQPNKMASGIKPT